MLQVCLIALSSTHLQGNDNATALAGKGVVSSKHFFKLVLDGFSYCACLLQPSPAAQLAHGRGANSTGNWVAQQTLSFCVCFSTRMMNFLFAGRAMR